MCRLASGGDALAQDSDGNTPLHKACMQVCALLEVHGVCAACVVSVAPTRTQLFDQAVHCRGTKA